MDNENKNLEKNQEKKENIQEIPFTSDICECNNEENNQKENLIDFEKNIIIEKENLKYEENDNQYEKKNNKKKIIVWVSVMIICSIFFFVGVILISNGYGIKKIEPKANIIKELTKIKENKQKKDVNKEHKNNAIWEEKDNVNSENNANIILDNTIIANDYVEDVKTLPDMIENTMPAMVSITATGVVSYYNPFMYGEIEEYKTESNGSGIIISQTNDELLILTNEHVINSTKEVSIGFIDETTLIGYVKSYDIESDLAIIGLKIEDIPKETLNVIKIATIGNSDNLRLGETVVAIGNSLGCGQSVTKGIVSAINREIELEDGTTRIFIQTDAPINPGNSGGALLNMKGEVVGINEVKIASSKVEGVGFAIPISNAIDIIDELKNKEHREVLANDEHGWLGISCRDVTADITEMYNIPTGVFVYDVAKGSSADIANIVSGDVIIEFDGNKVYSSTILVDLVSRYKVGETIEIKLLHYENGIYKEKNIELTLLAKEYE